MLVLGRDRKILRNLGPPRTSIEKMADSGSLVIKDKIGNHKKEYIRAYYLSEQELHKLIVENSKFSQKQLTSLVTFSGASLSKKTRQKLISIIEDRQM